MLHRYIGKLHVSKQRPDCCAMLGGMHFVSNKSLL